jgi:serine/threonine-protein kinase RsbT
LLFGTWDLRYSRSLHQNDKNMRGLEKELLTIMSRHMSAILAKSVLSRAMQRVQVPFGSMSNAEGERFCEALDVGLRLFVSDDAARAVCQRDLRALLAHVESTASPLPAEVLVEVKTEADVIKARSSAMAYCSTLSLPESACIKLATATSELARNILRYASSGQVVIRAIAQPRPGIEVIARDQGPGIADLDHKLSGQYKSKTGLGLGLTGTRRLVDTFDIQTAPDSGTTITIRKYRI